MIINTNSYNGDAGFNYEQEDPETIFCYYLEIAEDPKFLFIDLLIEGNVELFKKYYRKYFSDIYEVIDFIFNTIKKNEYEVNSLIFPFHSDIFKIESIETNKSVEFLTVKEKTQNLFLKEIFNDQADSLDITVLNNIFMKAIYEKNNVLVITLMQNTEFDPSYNNNEIIVKLLKMMNISDDNMGLINIVCKMLYDPRVDPSANNNEIFLESMKVLNNKEILLNIIMRHPLFIIDSEIKYKASIYEIISTGLNNALKRDWVITDSLYKKIKDNFNIKNKHKKVILCSTEFKYKNPNNFNSLDIPSTLSESYLSQLPIELIKEVFNACIQNDSLIGVISLRNLALTCKEIFSIGFRNFESQIYNFQNLNFAISNKKNLATIEHLLVKIIPSEETLVKSIEQSNIEAFKLLVSRVHITHISKFNQMLQSIGSLVSLSQKNLFIIELFRHSNMYPFQTLSMPKRMIQSTQASDNHTALSNSPFSIFPIPIIHKIFKSFIKPLSMKNMMSLKNISCTCKQLLSLSLCEFHGEIYNHKNLYNAIKNNKNISTIDHLVKKVNFSLKELVATIKYNNLEAFRLLISQTSINDKIYLKKLLLLVWDSIPGRGQSEHLKDYLVTLVINSGIDVKKYIQLWIEFLIDKHQYAILGLWLHQLPNINLETINLLSNVLCSLLKQPIDVKRVFEIAKENCPDTDFLQILCDCILFDNFSLNTLENGEVEAPKNSNHLKKLLQHPRVVIEPKDLEEVFKFGVSQTEMSDLVEKMMRQPEFNPSEENNRLLKFLIEHNYLIAIFKLMKHPKFNLNIDREMLISPTEEAKQRMIESGKGMSLNQILINSLRN